MAADIAVTGPAASEESKTSPERPRDDLLLRVAGLVVAVLAAAVSALIEVFMVPLRVGGVLIGLSLVLAVVGNVTLVWFTYRVTGWPWAVALPALAWFAVFLPASDRTTEGDLLLTGDNWVGITTILCGSIAFAIGAGRLILLRRPPGMGRDFR
jgi:hypothetical protein